MIESGNVTVQMNKIRVMQTITFYSEPQYVSILVNAHVLMIMFHIIWTAFMCYVPLKIKEKNNTDQEGINETF